VTPLYSSACERVKVKSKDIQYVIDESCYIQFPVEWVVEEFDQACVCTCSLRENEVEIKINIRVALKCLLLLGYSRYFIHLPITM
jgi:hypothetical protein